MSSSQHVLGLWDGRVSTGGSFGVPGALLSPNWALAWRDKGLGLF